MAGAPREGPQAGVDSRRAATRSADERVNAIVAASFAPSTMSRYKKVWRSYKSFAASSPGGSFPASPHQLTLYGLWLSDSGYKPATVATHLAGVGWWHKIKGLPDPSKNYLVKHFLRGLAKKGPPVKQATALRLNNLERVLGHLQSLPSAFESKLFRAAFSLAYYASLRVGEYAATPGASHALQLKDVGFVREGQDTSISLLLPTYKMSQRPAKLLVPQSPPNLTCPVGALKAYLKVRPKGEGQLFLQKSGKPLAAGSINARLKDCSRALGLEGSYSSHSLKAGRTTDLVEMNVPDAKIRESGRWRSDAYLQYVRFDVFKLPKGGPS